MNDCRILSLVKKNPFTALSQVETTLEGVGLHVNKYRGVPSRYKQLVTLMNRKARLDLARKTTQFWNEIIWTDETMINLYLNDGKRRV